MTLRRVVLGLGVLVLVAAAVGYFTVVPGRLAEDYRDSAQPAHERAHEASLLRRYVVKERRLLRRARRRIASARQALAAARKPVADVPEAPALNGSDELEAATAIAPDERRYLRGSRDFLLEYRKLIDYLGVLAAFLERAGTTVVRGVDDIPKNPGSVEVFAQPVDRLVTRIDRVTRSFSAADLRPGWRPRTA